MADTDEDARNLLGTSALAESSTANIGENVCEPVTGWDAIKLKVDMALFVLVMASLAAVCVIGVVGTHGREKTKFSMELAAFEGLNATTPLGPTTVSPAFTLKLRVESPGGRRPAVVVLQWRGGGGLLLRRLPRVGTYSGLLRAGKRAEDGARCQSVGQRGRLIGGSASTSGYGVARRHGSRTGASETLLQP